MKVEYMTFFMELRRREEKGREEGRAEGRAEGLAEGEAKGTIKRNAEGRHGGKAEGDTTIQRAGKATRRNRDHRAKTETKQVA